MQMILRYFIKNFSPKLCLSSKNVFYKKINTYFLFADLTVAEYFGTLWGEVKGFKK